MANPGYRLVDVDSTGEPIYDSAGGVTPEGAMVVLPVAERWGATIGWEESDLAYESERGRSWIYKQFSKRIRRVSFRFSAADWDAFEALHVAVGGQDTPFFYYPDSAVTAVYLFCRKEKDFLPRELDQEGYFDGVKMAVFDYNMDLREEPASSEVAV